MEVEVIADKKPAYKPDSWLVCFACLHAYDTFCYHNQSADIKEISGYTRYVTSA